MNLHNDARTLLEIIDRVPDACFALTDEGEIVYHNAAAGALHEHPDVPLPGGRIDEVLKLRGIPRPLPDMLSTLHASRGSARFEAGLLRGGTESPFDIWISTVPARERQLLLLLARDLSEYAPAATAGEVHREMLRTYTLLTTGVAHDVNNLINVVACHLSLLEAEGAREVSREQRLHAMQNALSAAGRLLGSMRHLANGGAGDDGEIDVVRLLRHVVDLVRPALGERVDVSLELNDPPATVRGSTEQFLSLLLNLALNAREAMPNGGTLTLRAEATDGGWLRLSVADSGRGMSEETVRHIFEPFYSRKGGNGVGLVMVSQAVRRVGGSIECRSEPGSGTTFEILLPPKARRMADRGRDERSAATS